MQAHCENIYKIARKSAGLTQIQAAEAINVSVRSLADYETGVTIPPDDVVCRMIEAYRAPWLGYEHLKYSTAVGQKYLPDIKFSDLARAVLRFQKEVKDLESVDRTLIEIACDGEVDETEKPKWREVTKEVEDVVSAALAILFTETQKEKALARAI